MSDVESCPFCPPPRVRVVEENDLAVAFNDAHPVSGGHCLVIPKRHIPSWFDATAEERAAMFELVDRLQKRLKEFSSPGGFNVGFNDGRVAGQTVYHMHVHVIPRYANDVPNPRGGIRNVIPGTGDYSSSED